MRVVAVSVVRHAPAPRALAARTRGGGAFPRTGSRHVAGHRDLVVPRGGAGTRLQRYFAEFAWKKDAARAGIPVGQNTVVLFAADDEKKGTLRLILDGVQYQMQGADNKPATSPEPKSPPKLIINYIADRENPDIARIEKGKF